MKAVILAAGLGSRLNPVTNKLPKCMLELGGQTIIERQVDSLIKLGINEIAVVVGYLKEQIIEHVGNKVEIIVNNDYAKTNSSYSLWLARNFLNDSFIYLNSDLLFDMEILKILIHSSSKNAMIVDKNINHSDDMFKANLLENKIVKLSKEIKVTGDVLVAPGPIKFSRGSSKIIFNMLDKIIKKGEHNHWCYSIFSALSREINLVPVYTNGLLWFEIDTPEDMEIAKSYLD